MDYGERQVSIHTGEGFLMWGGILRRLHIFTHNSSIGDRGRYFPMIQGVLFNCFVSLFIKFLRLEQIVAWWVVVNDQVVDGM